MVLFNSKYINIFFRYTLKSIVNSISCLNNKNYDFVIFITTSDKDLVSIKKKFNKINNLDLKIFYIIKNINKFKNKYKILSQFQVEHYELAKNKKYDYFLFLYADLILSKYSLLNSLKIIEKKNKIVVMTFALELLIKEKFKNFFFYYLKNNLKKCFNLIYRENLITNFHRNFELNSFYHRKSFFYIFNKDIFLLKTLHYHPFILNLNKITKSIIRNSKFESIDNGFLSYLNIKYNKIFAENNLSKLLLFSISTKSRLPLFKKYNFIYEKIRFLEFFCFFNSVNKSSNIEKKLFFQNTFLYKFNKVRNINKFSIFFNNIKNFEHNLNKNSIILYNDIFNFFKSKLNFLIYFFGFLIMIFFPSIITSRIDTSSINKYYKNSLFYKILFRKFLVNNFYVVKTIYMSIQVSKINFLVQFFKLSR